MVLMKPGYPSVFSILSSDMIKIISHNYAFCVKKFQGFYYFTRQTNPIFLLDEISAIYLNGKVYS